MALHNGAMSDVTQILSQIESGDPSAAGQLLPLVYGELRKLAAAKLAHEKPGQTLQATALVHEAYLRLVGKQGAGDSGLGTVESSADPHPKDPSPQPLAAPTFDSRGHFFAAAAKAMRRILVENARRKKRLKHGGDHSRVALEEADIVCCMPPDELQALDEALSKLAVEDPTKARLVELRFFVGMRNEEAADLLGISAVTAKRYWRYARAWLHREIDGRGESLRPAPDTSANS